MGSVHAWSYVDSNCICGTLCISVHVIDHVSSTTTALTHSWLNTVEKRLYVTGGVYVLKELGFDDSDKLVIINADDFGMCHSTNQAITHLLKSRVITSTTLMTPCPWAKEAIELVRADPESFNDVGLHLTFTSEWKNYKWGPIAGGGVVDTLVESEDGYFPAESGVVLQRADTSQVRDQIRIQIEFALRNSVDLTHVDDHMGTMGGGMGDRNFMDIVTDVCAEYRLPLRLADEARWGNPDKHRAFVRMAKDKGVLHVNQLVGLPFFSEEKTTLEDAKEVVIGVLQDLKPGITEIIFHPSLDTDELKAITDTWQARRHDYDVFLLDEVQQAMKSLEIKTIKWRNLRELQRRTPFGKNSVE